MPQKPKVFISWLFTESLLISALFCFPKQMALDLFFGPISVTFHSCTPPVMKLLQIMSCTMLSFICGAVRVVPAIFFNHRTSYLTDLSLSPSLFSFPLQVPLLHIAFFRKVLKSYRVALTKSSYWALYIF